MSLYLESASCIYIEGMPIVLCAVIKSSVKADPEGEGPPTREEEEEEEEEMQANPAYLPIEMSYNSQERQYLNVMMAPPNTCESEDYTKMQANPAYLPVEMSYKSQESKYINVTS